MAIPILRSFSTDVVLLTIAQGVAWDTPYSDTVERTKLVLGLAYGAASGTLSGLCLLFAKTGIDLLILTVIGKNQVSLRGLHWPPRISSDHLRHSLVDFKLG